VCVYIFKTYYKILIFEVTNAVFLKSMGKEDNNLYYWPSKEDTDWKPFSSIIRRGNQPPCVVCQKYRTGGDNYSKL